MSGRTLDDEIWSEHSHGGDAYAGFGGAVGGAEAGEDDGAGAAHRSEERLLCIVSCDMHMFISLRCVVCMLHVDASREYIVVMRIGGSKML